MADAPKLASCAPDCSHKSRAYARKARDGHIGQADAGSASPAFGKSLGRFLNLRTKACSFSSLREVAAAVLLWVTPCEEHLYVAPDVQPVDEAAVTRFILHKPPLIHLHSMHVWLDPAVAESLLTLPAMSRMPC